MREGREGGREEREGGSEREGEGGKEGRREEGGREGGGREEGEGKVHVPWRVIHVCSNITTKGSETVNEEGRGK